MGQDADDDRSPRATGTGPPSRQALADELARYARWRMDSGLVDLASGALGDALQTAVQKRYDLGRLSEGKACIARLTGEWKQCNHDLDLADSQQDLVDATPPHQPVPAVSTDLWLRAAEPAAFSVHLEEVDRETMTDLLAFGHDHDLDVVIDPAAFHDPLNTVHVLLIPREGPRLRRG
jgi:hypothetical protein